MPWIATGNARSCLTRAYSVDPGGMIVL
jgi:hypothetical protein